MFKTSALNLEFKIVTLDLFKDVKVDSKVLIS